MKMRFSMSLLHLKITEINAFLVASGRGAVHENVPPTVAVFDLGTAEKP